MDFVVSCQSGTNLCPLYMVLNNVKNISLQSLVIETLFQK